MPIRKCGRTIFVRMCGETIFVRGRGPNCIHSRLHKGDLHSLKLGQDELYKHYIQKKIDRCDRPHLRAPFNSNLHVILIHVFNNKDINFNFQIQICQIPNFIFKFTFCTCKVTRTKFLELNLQTFKIKLDSNLHVVQFV